MSDCPIPQVTEEMKVQALKRAYGIVDKPVDTYNEIDATADLKPVVKKHVEEKKNVCERHGMRKVVRGGSWKCKRR
jgi:hypothetical protein